jgi:hypothetical protein
MMIFTPRRTGSKSFDLSPESFNLDFGAQDPSACSPILSNPGSLMIGAMFSSNTFGDFMNTQPYGPTEAFFSLASDQPTDAFSDSSDIEQQMEEDECKLLFEDFVTFQGHDSTDEEDAGGEEEEGVEWNGVPSSSPTRPRTAASGTSAATDSSVADVHPLLNHFDNNSDAVGAFRRDQINRQLIYSDKASRDSLAFSGPYYHGTLRGIKTGSMSTVTTPITPARRPRRSNTVGTQGVGMQDFDLQGSPSQKRKASSSFADNLHKRHRSISDVGGLQISSNHDSW